ncbi:MAG: PQQ-like beta-propeller repeat protein [Mycobacteriaceae bacterium]|nr:PQQ-like beta-propeller repeat protein [Mycobacteriaceae bacterium]
MKVTRRAGAAAVVGACLLLAACGGADTESETPSLGWPGAHGNSRNTAASAVTGTRALSPAWWRPLGGTVSSGPSISEDGQLFVTTTRSAVGCNIMSFLTGSGRKRMCNNVPFTKPVPDPVLATPLVDGDDNVYVGVGDGTLRSYNKMGQERWVMPLLGTPQSAQFTADGNVLVVTHLGEVDVFDRQTGKVAAGPYRLQGEPDHLAQANMSWPSADKGLDDCFTGKSGCTVAGAPALETASGRFYLTAWLPNASAASLVALRYENGQIEKLWTAPVLSGGSTTSPALSADGMTVYVGDNSGELLAVDTESGKTRWTHRLGFTPFGGMSVSGDGTVIPGSLDGKLVALRDREDRAEKAWERNDLVQTGVPVQAAGSTGYTVVKGTDGAPALLTFNIEDGTPIAQSPYPDEVRGAGPAVGAAVGPHGEVAVASRSGELVLFAKPR